MANFHRLQVYHLGQQQLRDIAVLSDGVCGVSKPWPVQSQYSGQLLGLV
jgi:hypothetical protein